MERELFNAYALNLRMIEKRILEDRSPWNQRWEDFGISQDILPVLLPLHEAVNKWHMWRVENPLSMLICDHNIGNAAREARLYTCLYTRDGREAFPKAKVFDSRMIEGVTNSIRLWDSQLPDGDIDHPFTLPASQEILKATEKISDETVQSLLRQIADYKDSD